MIGTVSAGGAGIFIGSFFGPVGCIVGGVIGETAKRTAVCIGKSEFSKCRKDSQRSKRNRQSNKKFVLT